MLMNMWPLVWLYDCLFAGFITHSNILIYQVPSFLQGEVTLDTSKCEQTRVKGKHKNYVAKEHIGIKCKSQGGHRHSLYIDLNKQNKYIYSMLNILKYLPLWKLITKSPIVSNYYQKPSM